MRFKIKTKFKPNGDQPEAILKLAKNLAAGVKEQTLLGVTGSGKTFTIANVIEKVNRPTVIMAHNKTLAAQLYEEFREIFPDNAVHYFVSYYDYYQPEAYIPSSNTYIAKDSQINDHIDQLRHASTSALFNRKDVIIVSSVSCIYGIGSPKDYFNMTIELCSKDLLERETLLEELIKIQYTRSRFELTRGTFRAIGNNVDIIPSNFEDKAVKVKFQDDKILAIYEIDPLSGEIIEEIDNIIIFPSTHYVVEKMTTEKAIKSIEAELKKQVGVFRGQGKLDEMKRIQERTANDLELMEIMGFCPGIENYSRHLDQRVAGEPPYTLIDYFPEDFLLVIDESHQTIPQIKGMHAGDKSRKQTLVDHGFRLPSALDNRPLNITEFENKINQIIYVSATPAEYEKEKSGKNIVEQIIRPTGLVDPTIEVRSAKNQIENLLSEIKSVVEKNEKILVTTLTKKMAEEITSYFKGLGIRVEYMHSDIKTLERVEILKKLRNDEFDVLVGINLLREGLDLPEVSLVAILDADKEGYLRSQTSLIQTFGRAARNLNGRVIMYADEITKSMEAAIKESNRRRTLQCKFNDDNAIIPKSITKDKDSDISSIYNINYNSESIPSDLDIAPHKIPKEIEKLRKEMNILSNELKFEEAGLLRDKIKILKKLELAYIEEIA
ncbi:MAG: excinuclease ABC subunit UvrB [Thermodesulfobacteriota bacterium]|nr:excinuclease ABC subunit UvrB [Deltaproteobacteria bacterium TMED58]RZP16224.1 MAG: excinuclease ABC subunit UvrB [Candidatus Dadabacteria bacterium]|tara:strand:+ start:46649 stop:48643 length:1995 start_codon:yes stop_codon:yes gene_type:complete